MSKTVCIKECPKNDNQPIECFPTKNVTSCDQLKAYDTFIFAGGFCIPTEKETMATIGALFSGLNIESAIESIYINRYVLLGCLVFAFALSYFFSFFLQHCTWLIVLISIVGVYALGIYVSAVSWRKYQTLKAEASSTKAADDELITNANFYKYTSICIWSILSLVLIITVCLFDRIKLAVKVIKAAAEFVGDEKAIVLVPMVLFVVKAAYVSVHLYGAAAIFSTGEIYHNPEYPWGKIRYSETLK